jgi:hypothetical protein
MNPVLYDELHDALSDIYEAMLDNGHDELYGLTLMQVEGTLDTLEMEPENLTTEDLSVLTSSLDIRSTQLEESLNSTVGLSEEDQEYFLDAIVLVQKAQLALQEYSKSL